MMSVFSSTQCDLRRSVSDRLLLWGAVVVLWVGLLPSVLPGRCCDRGVFVSVAERLLAGDKLYEGVFDNKEPLFYYSVALQRWAGSSGEFIFEITVLALASLSAYIIATSSSLRTSAILIGALATPIILTGTFYYAGYTHLPGAFLCLAALAMATRGRNRWSGAAIGALFFTKIIMAPIALCSVLAFLGTSSSFATKWKELAHGIAAALSVGLAVIYERDELSAFLNTLYLNILYSQGEVLSGNSLAQKTASHLRSVLDAKAITILAANCGCLLGAWLRSDQNSKPLLLAATASFCGSLIVLAMTGLWDHHNQILYVPAVLSLTALAVTNIRVSAVIGVAATMLFAWVLGGARSPSSYVEAIAQFPVKWAVLNEVPLETVAMLASAKPSTYARLGANDDGGHAIGLGSWKLACPKFHQYEFDTTDSFEQVLSCVATVETVLVAASFIPVQGWVRWNSFVQHAEEILQSQFVCKHQGALRVCNRR